MFELIKDLWAFMRVRKKFWLLPLVIALLLFGVLLAIGQGPAAPFIYRLF